MKKNIYYFAIFFLFIIFIYTVNITNIPSQVLLFGDEKLSIRKMIGIETIETSSVVNNNTNKTNVEVKLFNLVSVKNVSVTNLENYEVVPIRKSYRFKIIY